MLGRKSVEITIPSCEPVILNPCIMTLFVLMFNAVPSVDVRVVEEPLSMIGLSMVKDSL